MSDTFREPTPIEVQHALIQFMGQNMGDLKSLDENLINKTNTLQGMTLRPKDVLQTIPVTRPQPTHNPPPPPPQQVVQAPEPQITVEQPIVAVDPNDPVQLEFNFDNNPYTKTVFIELNEIKKTVDEHTRHLKEIIKKLEKIDQAFFLKEKNQTKS